MSKETTKATISLKAESMADLLEALQRIADESGMQIILQASVSTSIKLEAVDASDVGLAIGDIMTAISSLEGVVSAVNAPGSVWHGRRLDATPMERYINSSEPSDLFPGKEKSAGERALNWLEAREQRKR